MAAAVTALTPVVLLAAAAGAAAAAGLALAVAGCLSAPPDGRPPRRPGGAARARRWWRGALRGSHGDGATGGSGDASSGVSGAWHGWRDRRLRAAVGLVAGALAWLLSGWLIAVVVLPVAAVGLPELLGRADTGRHVERLEALEEWTRNLVGVLDVGVGLEQALAVSLRSTPEPVRPQVQALVARLRARWPTDRALRAFAADLDDATGDLVAASLVLAARRRGPGLTRVLDGLAETVADEVRMRRQVEADRAKPRTTARAVTVITLVVLGVLALNSAYMAPYGTPTGQLVLALLLGLYGAALVWMRAMTRTRPAPRFLTTSAGATVRSGSGGGDRRRQPRVPMEVR